MTDLVLLKHLIKLQIVKFVISAAQAYVYLQKYNKRLIRINVVSLYALRIPLTE